MQKAEPASARRTGRGSADIPPSGERLLLVFDFGELGVDDIGIGSFRAARGAAAGCLVRGAAFSALRLRIHLLAELLAGRRQSLHPGFDRVLVVALQRLFRVLHRLFDLFLLVGADLVAVFGQRFLHRMHQRVALVADIDQLVGLLVFLGVRRGVLHHALDLVLGQARVRLDLDLVLLAGRLVLRRDVQDAVRVDVERDLDLRHAARSGRDVGQVELAEALVAGGHFTFALQHVDRHRALVVVGRREHLARLRRHGGVLLDQLRHHAAERLDAERQRGHVEQQHVLDFALQHAALDRCADGNGFVRVHVAARFLAEELLDLLLHLRHPALAADQDHVVDVVDLQAGILQCDAARFDCALHQIFDERFEFGARDLHCEVLRTRRIGGDVGQVHFGLLARRQFDLRLLGRFLQALQREHVLLQVDALFLLELGDDVVDQALVEVLAAEESVAVRREHFELVFAVDVGDFDDGDIEGAAAEVINRDLRVARLLVHAERERCGGRLVDDALDLEPCDAAGVLGRLALAVVEVGRHRDDGFGDFLAEVVLGSLLHLAQHFGGDLRRGDFLAAHFDPRVAVVGLADRIGHQVDVLLYFLLFEAAADQALDGEQRVLRVRDRLALGRRAGQDLAVFRVRDDGRGGTCAFGVFDDLGLAAFHHGDAAIRRAQVDTDDFSHCRSFQVRGEG
ncbi:putative NAD-specific glutamate dehydrogenase encoded in antisense gene pair with dnaKJ [Aromatoleum aromaticum EbN1]|uniref:NAD-specific glutamate dehydrogenase encoded in antisense gene pair with dnaKJ n=1 Tax=Aromatoleum aromaticum (strain DSM 19018 / LMG 30748 / EbN1) TaxID=76114 RepID=Q5P1H6_AROAE|nr:putative NAD-specific glutamate dehydrogenase encoded in antisense gene pair with dnaKJ [Aromatoleum aromaticum EbN1]